MKRIILKNLIVISKKEHKSREINLDKGLNIIIGKNKTGKSSLVKSIFHTLGCNVKMEKEWKKLIDIYLLFFKVDLENYCIVREGDFYKIFKITGDNNDYEQIIATDSFHTYSDKLMEMLEVSMDCITNDGKLISVTPPLLFRFQYIDQDRGWEKIGESFSNMKYVKDWKGNTNKYVSGFQGEDFYKLKQEKEIIRQVIDEYENKLAHFEEFIGNLKLSMGGIENADCLNDEQNANNKETVKDLFNQLDFIEKECIQLEEILSKLKNQRYEKALELSFIKNNVSELEADHQFAMQEDDTLKCPFCGVVHDNKIENRIEIVKDIQSGNALVKIIRKDIEELDLKIGSLINQKNEYKLRYKFIKRKLEKEKDNISVINVYKNEGKLELVNTSLRKQEEVKIFRDKGVVQKEKLEEKLAVLNSNERRNNIYKELKCYCREVFDLLNLPHSAIKFNDFVQRLEKTGSEHSRIVYAYHISLYLYNLNRCKSPFNLLVIDTPNQQGQDAKNLKNIDSVLESLMSEEGQVIIGTERETGYEGVANTVTKLSEEKKCLNTEEYQKHIDIVNALGL